MPTPEVVQQVKEKAANVKASLEALKNETDPERKKEKQAVLREQNEDMESNLITAQLAILANEVDPNGKKPQRYEMVEATA